MSTLTFLRPLSIGALLAACALTPAAGYATTAAPDTIKTITNAQSVSVTRDGNTTTIRVLVPADKENPKGDIFTYTVTEEPAEVTEALAEIKEESILRLPFTSTRRKSSYTQPFKPSRYITGLRYIYWGWDFNYDSKAGIKNSYEVGVADLIGAEWATSRHTRLGLGLGFGMQRVTTADRMLFSTESEKLTIIAPPEGAEVNYARWDNYRIQLPLYWRQRLAGPFGISLAAIVNFNTYSSATNCYRIGRTRYKQTIHGLNQRLLTVDLMASAGIVDGIGVYAKWSPVTSMQTAYGPSFRTFSIGINVNF